MWYKLKKIFQEKLKTGKVSKLSISFAGSKYQYSQQTSYIYSYEASNELQTVKASDMSMKIKATVTITAVSKCEMVLEVR